MFFSNTPSYGGRRISQSPHALYFKATPRRCYESTCVRTPSLRRQAKQFYWLFSRRICSPYITPARVLGEHVYARTRSLYRQEQSILWRFLDSCGEPRVEH